ncbi:MAG: choice-of-anchor D domain-containing protein [Pseudomonadota bacterium]
MKKPHSHSNGWRRLARQAGACTALLLGSATAAQAADALNGKSLYANGPVAGGAPRCANCHGADPANNALHILRGANDPAALSHAFTSVPAMISFAYGSRFSTAEVADLAAYLGNPAVVAAPVAELAPSVLIFGSTSIGQSSAPLSTTLSNSGSAPLTLGGISLAGAAAADYSVGGGSCAAGATIAPHASCTVQLAFRPTAAGARSASLNISHNATGAVSTLALSGTGDATPQAGIGVSATGIDFGALLTGTASGERTVNVSNSGQAPLVFSAIALGGANAAQFALGGSCAPATPVAPGAACGVTVRAAPTAPGALAASLTLSSNASNGNVTIALSGNASAAAPAISATPASLSFGAQALGVSVSRTVTLNNGGNVALSLGDIAISGSPGVTLATAGNTCGATLAVGAHCDLGVLFTPAATGDVAANLVVSSNAPALQVGITGSGSINAVAQPSLSDKLPIVFDDTGVGAIAAPHSTSFSNPSNVALSITALALQGDQGGDFTLGGTCAAGTTLAPAASCTIETALKPTAAGLRSSTVLIATDSGAQFTLSLSGNGVAIAAPAPALTVQPQSFDFGSALIGGVAGTKVFTISNASSGAVTVGGAVFSGPFAAATGTAPGACAAPPFTLAPGANCELTVQYQPSAAGTNNGNLVLNSDTGASWSVALAGSADVAPPVVNVVSNQGGGGCSAARDGDDATLALLVLLALGVLGWRRRLG